MSITAPGLGVQVTTSEAPPSSGVPTNTATAFVVGRADQGTATTYTRLTSIIDFAATYGPRSTTNSPAYDAVDTMFRAGVPQVYFGRLVGNGNAAASLTLLDSGTHPTMVVTADWPGVNGNGLYIVVAAAGGNYTITLQDVNGNVIAQSPSLATQAAGIAWSATAPDITITAATGGDSTTNNPVALTATALTGGTDAVTTVAEQDTVALGAASAGSVVCSFVWNGTTYTTASIAWNAIQSAVLSAFNAATPPLGGTPLPSPAFTATGGPFPAAVVLTQTAGMVGAISGQTITPTGLTGGTATYVQTVAGTGVTLTQWNNALGLFPFSLGPGQVLAPGQTNTTMPGIWGALLFHGYTFNRFACMDLDSASPAALIADVAATSAAYYASYGIFDQPTCQIPGVTSGTTRTVAASAVRAGLCAQVDALGNPNIAAAGRSFPLPYVVGFNFFGGAQTSDTDVLLLNQAGINTFELRYSELESFGFSTPVPAETDPIFWQASHSRLRMALVADAYAVGEPFVFAQIDGKGVEIGAFATAISAMLLGYYNLGALYGNTPADAFVVNVGPPVNTPATIAAGELNAQASVRMSPFAQLVTINLTAVPTTQSLP